ncbi:MAG: hypothetical protein ACXV79_17400 [Methylobacter sp.]
MRKNPIARWAAIAALASFTSGPALAENFERGQELFEDQCGGCHNNFVALNKDSKIKTMSALKERIVSWAAHTGSEWGNSEFDDVLYYLNKSFYHFTDKEL